MRPILETLFLQERPELMPNVMDYLFDQHRKPHQFNAYYFHQQMV